MEAPAVLSLPEGEIEAFLDRRRYAAFVPIRLKVDAFLREILAKANEFVPSSAGSILMDRPLDRGPVPEQTELTFVAVFGPSARELLGRSLPASQGAVGHVYRTGEPYLMTDPDNDPLFFRRFDRQHGFETHSLVAVPIRIEETWRVAHSPFDERLVQRVLDTAEALGYPSLYMVSGAGHDASYMNQVAPTAMIFVPSIGGRSHVEVENTTWEDCEAGANVLLHSILQSANDGDVLK